jgi:hypothetical protein
VVISATPLLGGHVRPGAWAAVEVTVTNSGPPITGELRIRGQQQGQSRYGVEADLPSGARQQFTLYAQTAIFGNRVFVDLVSGEQVIQTQQVGLKSHDAYNPIVGVIAERPEGLLKPVTDAMRNPNQGQAVVISLTIPDLPSRVEAWAALDRLVWQDADASNLTEAQLDALRLWVGAGGELIVLGGTTGPGVLQGFNRGDSVLLPYSPTRTVDAPAADLASLLGTIPEGATTASAYTGALDHGAVLARSGEDVIAASGVYGRGSVTVIGFNPADPWIADSAASETLWHRLLPLASGPGLNPLTITDDSQIVYQLQNLPSIDLPPIEQLFILLVAYIALIGPINYLILRRLDRREWAWVTIPALVVVFAFGSYGLGATLKGSDIIVNEIAVVRAAQGSTRGIGQAYIGIYSPSRRSYDVRLPGGALLSNPTSLAQFGQTETPLDVVFGNSSSRLRNFEVGFGVLRGFRAEAPASAPQIDADLHLADGKLVGPITNASQTPLENVAVVFGGSVENVASLAAGESKQVDLDVTSNSFVNFGLSQVIFGTSFPRDSAEARTVATRRAVIDSLFPWSTTSSSDAPMLLAWAKGPVLDVEIAGDRPNRVGEGLFMVPLAMAIDSHQIFSDQMMRRAIVDTTAANGWADSGGMYLSRGTLTVETRPVRFAGTFHPASLEVAITQGDVRALGGNGEAIEPLPADQQPSQDDPLAEAGPAASPGPSTSPVSDCARPPCNDVIVNPGGGGKPAMPGAAFPGGTIPALQLFDRATQQWVEFPQPKASRSYLIGSPEKYVDESGAVLFRFVNRNEQTQFGEEQMWFQLQLRLEGTIN